MMHLIRTLAWRKFARSNARSTAELRTFPNLSPADRRSVLSRRLLDQLRFFAARKDALPEWREIARVRTADELWRMWPQLPVLDKRTLRTHFDPMEMRKIGVSGTAKSTGGSTGEPTHFLHDEAMIRSCNAATLHAWESMGWSRGMTVVTIWGSERDIGRNVSRRMRLTNVLRGVYIVDGYKMTDETVDTVVRHIQSNRKVAVYGFSSMLEFVAREVTRRGIDLNGHVAAAWNGGEMLLDTQIATFRQAFGRCLHNLYGGRELSTMAYQPREGGPLELTRPWLFLEVLTEDGRPAGVGEPGRLVWTSTVCRGTPFLRYDIGDVGMFDAAGQDESGVTQLRQLHGRFAGLLKLANGRVINCIYWNHLLKEYPEVHQFQVQAARNGDLRLLFEGHGFSEARERELRSTLRQFLGDIRIDITWVDSIPRTRQGKLLQVVRETCSP